MKKETSGGLVFLFFGRRVVENLIGYSVGRSVGEPTD